MAIPNQFIDELIHRCDILEIVSRYVTLKKQGSNYVGLCPFHNEKTPSFSVNAGKQLFYCFGCHTGGGIIQFIMKIENIPYRDAIEVLAKQAGMTIPEDKIGSEYRKKRERQKKLNRDAARFFYSCLTSEESREGYDYLRRRQISDNTIRRFGLGFAPNAWDRLMSAMIREGYEKSELLDVGLIVEGKGGHVYDRFRNRVMFPIIDLRGDVIGFGGRVIDDSQPKYLNSPETAVFSKGRNLFAMNLVKKERTDELLLAEGYMDVIALHQAGFRTAVASLGTALTSDQAKMMRHYASAVTIVYDADAAGQTATARAIDILRAAGLTVRILRVPDSKDPDEFIKKNGADAFRNLLSGTQGDLTYRLSRLIGPDGLTTPEAKTKYLTDAAALLSTVTEPVERDVYIRKVAQDTDSSADALTLQVNKAIKARQKKARGEELRRVANPVRMVQPKARELRFDNPKAARAEERILALLFHDLALCKTLRRENIDSAHFTVPLYRKTVEQLLEYFDRNESVTLDGLSQEMTDAETSQLAAILAQTPVTEAERVMSDCIDVLKMEHIQENLSLEELIRAKK
ncbi:MAG: DNA primase [Clostridiales bacterium]|nr:DNA primase [Clostridiales bacterium]